MTRRWSAVFVGALIGLAGCSSPSSGVEVPPGGDRLPACPVSRLPVESLGSGAAPSCNWEGSTLVFPGGRTMQIAGVGISSASVSTDDPGVETRAVNWGVPGVAAVLIRDGAVQVWGHSRQAVELQLEGLSKEGIGLDGKE